MFLLTFHHFMTPEKDLYTKRLFPGAPGLIEIKCSQLNADLLALRTFASSWVKNVFRRSQEWGKNHVVYIMCMYIYIYDVLCKYDHCISQQFWVVHNLRLKNWSFQAPPLDCFSQLMMQLLDEPLDVNHKWCWKRLDNPRNAGFHREIQHVPRVLSLSVRKSMLKTSTHQSIFARKYHCEAPSFHWTCVLNHGSHISLADNFVDQSVNRASLLSPQKSKCMYSISSIQVHLLKCSTTSGFHPFGYFRYHILVHPLL